MSQFDLIYMFYGGVITVGLAVLITVLVMTLSQIRRTAKNVENLTDTLEKEIEPTMAKVRDLTERMSFSTKAFDRLTEEVEVISGSVKKLSSLADRPLNSPPLASATVVGGSSDGPPVTLSPHFSKELRRHTTKGAGLAKNETMKMVLEEIVRETRKMVEEEDKKLESLIEMGWEMIRSEPELAGEVGGEAAWDGRKGNPAEE